MFDFLLKETDMNRLEHLWNRRRFLSLVGSGVSAAIADRLLAIPEERGVIHLPFANGERQMVVYPEKRPLIRHTTRPPQLETPFSVFREGLLTPNDAFFVRYHLANIPLSINLSDFRLNVVGVVKEALSLSLADLKKSFPIAEVVAVNQCSGNSRGFVQPRVAGGQLGHGAMGNARWRGVPLKKVLEKAGVGKGAKFVTFRGLDSPVLPMTPAFIKALPIDHALSEDILLAFEMNGEDLPMLNGYPLRLVVPGYYGTYWVKHLSEIRVIDHEFDGFFVAKGYRLPDNDCGCVEPGKAPNATKPITRMVIRSFITSHEDGAGVTTKSSVLVQGIAFDGGSGIREVMISQDDGRTWQAATLGKDLGRYSFRPWQISLNFPKAGEYNLKVRAKAQNGEIQPISPSWNPSGYRYNPVENVRVVAT